MDPPADPPPVEPRLASVAWKVVHRFRKLANRNSSDALPSNDIELKTVDGEPSGENLTKLPRGPSCDTTRRITDYTQLARVVRTCPISVFVTEYNKETIQTSHYSSEEQIVALVKTLTEPSKLTRWVHIAELSEELLNMFLPLKLHESAIQDSLHFPVRPAMEVDDHSLFIILQALSLRDAADCLSGLHSIQISLFLCEHNVLLSSTLNFSDVLAPVREKLLLGDSRLRTMDCSYLLNVIIGMVVHLMEDPMDAFGDLLSDLEHDIIRMPDRALMKRVHFLKRELGMMRRQAWPTRELLSALENCSTPLIAPAARDHIRALYDHTVQVIDMIETYRDIGTGLLELFTSRLSSEMGKVVRWLTILQVFFLPAIFFAAVYGMNFHLGMWELEWEYGYYMFWSLVVLAIIVEIIVFRIKGWL